MIFYLWEMNEGAFSISGVYISSFSIISKLCCKPVYLSVYNHDSMIQKQNQVVDEFEELSDVFYYVVVFFEECKTLFYMKRREDYMSITQNLDATESTRYIDRAYFGPGCYVLYDGRARDSNIVYIGKSRCEILVRISAHYRTKDFNRVGVILPRRTTPNFVHNLEAALMEEYLDYYGELPLYNRQGARYITTCANRDWISNWHRIPRRPNDIDFQ